MIIKTFVGKHPVLDYFALTFAISWGGFVLAVDGIGAFPGDPTQFETLMPFVAGSMLAGHSVSGLLLTSLMYGKAGLRGFLSRLLK